MAIHRYITHYLGKHKELIVSHVNRHHKKYLFGGGMAFGIMMVGAILVAGTLLGINMVVEKSQASDQETQIYKQISTFSFLDDFLHERYDTGRVKSDPMTASIDQGFTKYDTAYHEAKNMHEKYIAAKNFVDFLTNTGYDFIKNIGYMSPDDERWYQGMIYEFYQIR